MEQRAHDAAVKNYMSKGSPEFDHFISGFYQGWHARRRVMKPKVITETVYMPASQRDGWGTP